MEIVLAAESHIDDVFELIRSWADLGQLLPRTKESLAGAIGSLLVAVSHDRVIGVVGLQALEPTVSEVRSLAVARPYQGQGTGRQLVLRALDLAKMRQCTKVITFTRQVVFFQRCGFVVAQSTLPAKYYLDCVNCPMLLRCDETAMEWIPQPTVDGSPL